MLSLEGGVSAYLEAISEIHGSDALEKYIASCTHLKGQTLKDKEKIVEFVGSKHASKPALSQYVVKKYIEDYKDNPVPRLFRRVIDIALSLSE